MAFDSRDFQPKQQKYKPHMEGRAKTTSEKYAKKLHDAKSKALEGKKGELHPLQPCKSHGVRRYDCPSCEKIHKGKKSEPHNY